MRNKALFENSTNTVDHARVSKIETILTRVSRRMNKTVTGLLTPYPISNYCNEPVSDIVLRYMFPSNGKITVGAMYIEDMPKGGVNIVLYVGDATGGGTKTYTIKRKDFKLAPNLPVSFGSRLTIGVKPVVEEEIVKGIWTSFMWVPDVKDVDVKTYLLDELLALEETNNAGLKEEKQ